MPDDNHNFQDFKLVDLLSAQEVDIQIDASGKLWVNLNGKCLLRVGKCFHVQIEDKRERKHV